MRRLSEEELRQKEKEERSRMRLQEQAYREAQRSVYARIYQEQDAMPEDYREAFRDDPGTDTGTKAGRTTGPLPGRDDTGNRPGNTTTRTAIGRRPGISGSIRMNGAGRKSPADGPIQRMETGENGLRSRPNPLGTAERNGGGANGCLRCWQFCWPSWRLAS